MFRPVAITFGPDGCLYITDWYNRIISHNEVARDHPARDKERGRVWRVRHKSQSDRLIPDMTKVADNELPSHLSAPSVWEMRAAWHQIGTRNAVHLAPQLVAVAQEKGRTPSARIHAVWALAELGHFDAALWKLLLGDADEDIRRESVRALDLLQVSPNQAFSLLEPLGAETAWAVRYAVLRYFRNAKGPRDPRHAAWLKRWSEAPAPTEQIKGWGGTYLALGGSYERAFQDFLLELALSGKPAAELLENRWDKAIATEPPPSAEATARLKHRIETIKPLVAKTPPEQGRIMTETLCLACHVAGGKGVSLAPPLDGSSKRDIDGLLTAILAPNEAIEQAFRLFRIHTKAGGTLEGFKKREDAKEITVLLMGGIEQKVAHDEVKSAGYVTGRSVMPPVADGMSDEQIAAIAAFLRTLP
jgi:putative heme-binding domain-containing protein